MDARKIENDADNQSSQPTYQIGREIGKGSFGKVHHGILLPSRKECAIKIIGSKYKKSAEGELALLKYLQEKGAMNRNIGMLIAHTNNEEETRLTFEYYEIDLLEYIRKQRLFRLPEARAILSQLLDAIAHLHRLGVVHCDIKPNNIMLVDSLERPLVIKLIDFGCSYHPDLAPWRKELTYVGHKIYRAPELAIGSSCSYPVDMWAFACVAHELVLDTLFYGSTSFEIMGMIIKAIGMPDKEILKKGKKAGKFFKKDGEGCRLKTIEEFNEKSEKKEVQKDREGCFEQMERFENKLNVDEIRKRDRQAFVSMIKELVVFDPEQRPAAMSYRPHFLSMDHLAAYQTSPYFKNSIKKLRNCITSIDIVKD